MKGGRKIEELLQRKGEDLEIPKKLEPERILKELGITEAEAESFQEKEREQKYLL